MTKQIILLLCYFFSGATSLAYEIVWARRLEVVLGSSTLSVSSILASFMGGLALGSLCLGKSKKILQNPITSYALLELGIGIYALLTSPIYQVLLDAPFGLYIKYPLSILSFFLPPFLMGGTWPAILQAFLNDSTGHSTKQGQWTSQGRPEGRHFPEACTSGKYYGKGSHGLTSAASAVSLLYGTNTAGAAFGSLITGFYFIYHLGLSKTNQFAAVTSLVISVISLLLSKLRINPPTQDISLSKTDHQLNPRFYLGSLCLFLCGFASMIYEVLWTRFLTLVLGSSVYAFSTVLITFLLGIALGSFAISHWIDRSKNLFIWIYFLQISLALSILISLPLLNHLPLLFYKLYQYFGSSFLKIELIQFLIASLTLLLPTVLMGATFPCLMKLSMATNHLNLVIAREQNDRSNLIDKNSLNEIAPASPDLTVSRVEAGSPPARNDAQGSKFGFLYGINCLGNMVGSMAASLLFLPIWGIETSLIGGTSIFILIACLQVAYSQIPLGLSIHDKFLFKVFLISIAMILGTSFVFLPKWNLRILTSGISVYAQKYSELGINSDKLRNELERSKILYSKDGWTSHVTVREYAGVRSLLINGKADGSDGHDIQTELLAAHLPLLLHTDPKSLFVIGLGTGITLRAAETYSLKKIDCVEIEKRVIEASQFFEKTNFNALKDQRLHLICNDARHILTWTKQKYDCIISEPSNPWLAGIGSLYTTQMFEEIKNHLEPGGIVCQWVHYYNMSPTDLKVVIRTFQSVFPNTSLWGQPHLSDLFLIGEPVEGRAAKQSSGRATLSKALKNKKIKRDLDSIQLADPKIIQSLKWLKPEELKAFAGEGKMNTDDHPILEFSAPRHLYQDTMSLNLRDIISFRKLRKKPEDLTLTHFLKAMVHYYEKNSKNYLLELKLALQQGSKWKRLMDLYGEAVYQEAEILFKKNESQAAFDLLISASQLVPESSKIQYTLGYLYQEERKFDPALEHYLRAVKIDPEFSEGYNNLGSIYLSLADHEKAFKSFKKALEIQPLYLEAHLNLAHSLLAQKALEGAELEFKLCLKIDPSLSSAHNGLGVTLAMQKRYREAVAEFKKALDLDPKNGEAMKNLERAIKEEAKGQGA